MTQLLCNGVRLDLYDNTSLQVVHTNPLFAFDKLECERTTTIKIPSTPTNDRIFGLSRLPAYSGAGMMSKFAAQMIDGTIVKNGYLYVKSYSDEDYEAIFVFGDLLALQAIRQAGKIGDYYAPSVYTAQYGVPATTPSNTLFQTLKYANSLILYGGLGRYTINDVTLRPCINLYILLVQGLQQVFGFNMPSVPADLQNLVFIPKEYKDAQGNIIDTQGSTISLQYNMPDWTGVELMKMLANLGGYLLNFEGNTLSFVSALSELYAPVDITSKLIRKQSVQRDIDGYAQKNYIKWKDADTYRVQNFNAAYSISNDNINEKQDLYTIPAQPSQYVSIVQPTLADVALVWDTYATSYLGTIRNPMGSDFVARWRVNTGADEDTLRAYALTNTPPLNPIMQRLCKQATSIKASVRMSMIEYYGLTNLSTLLVDGSRYVWTERNWQDDIAQFTLAKIA